MTRIRQSARQSGEHAGPGGSALTASPIIAKLIAFRGMSRQKTTMADPDASNDPRLQPRSIRQSVFLIATVERFGAPGVTSHRVRDLSQSGMRLDKAGNFMTGATIVVTVGAYEAVGATVVWVKDDQAGIRFVQPIDPDQARAKTALHAAKPSTQRGPSAGWVPDLANPYGKK